MTFSSARFFPLNESSVAMLFVRRIVCGYKSKSRNRNGLGHSYSASLALAQSPTAT
jgi:hypothetical protein